MEDEDGAPVWYVDLRGKENSLVSMGDLGPIQISLSGCVLFRYSFRVGPHARFAVIEFPPGAFLEGHFNMHVGI